MLSASRIMTTLSSKMFILARHERNWLTKCHLFQSTTIPQVLECNKSYSSKSTTTTTESKKVEKTSEGKILVDPGVVIDPDDRYFAHKDIPIQQKKKEYTDEELVKIQDKSRLRPIDRRLLNGQITYEEPKFWTHKTVKYQRKMYAKHGEATGINPGIQWPIPSELETRLEWESVAHPFTFHEMVEKIEQRKIDEAEAIRKREIEIETNMAKAEKLKEEYFARIKSKEKDTLAAQEKKEKLVEEVRRHFGYKVDEREEQFQEMLEKKEKEQRKAAKEAKKLAKQKQEIAKLTGGGDVTGAGGKEKAEVKTKSESKSSKTSKSKKEDEDSDSDEDK